MLSSSSRRRVVRALAFVALIIASLPALAFASSALSTDPQVKVELTGYVVRNDHNVPVEKVDRVSPGELLTWSMTLTNSGPGAATNLRVRGHISTGTVYVIGSAAGDSQPRVQFSIDGGRSFSERPTVWITGSDGVKREVPAPVESYTDIQFIFATLGEREVKTARYQTRVR